MTKVIVPKTDEILAQHGGVPHCILCETEQGIFIQTCDDSENPSVVTQQYRFPNMRIAYKVYCEMLSDSLGL